MAYHNPFIVNGRIKFPDNTNLVKHVEKWAKVRGDQLAYRFLDFSTERDGVASDISGPSSAPATARSAPGCSRSPSRATASPSCARRTWTTSSRSSAPCTPAGSRCRCSIRPSRVTSAGCTRCSTTAARRRS